MNLALIPAFIFGSAEVAIILAIAVIILLLAAIVSNFKIVPQAHAYVIERLGTFHATWGTGLHFKIPFID